MKSAERELRAAGERGIVGGMKKRILTVVAAGMAALFAGAGAGQAASIAKSPYIGAIVVDASDGRVLFEDGADRVGYPASMLKLMDMMLVFDRVKDGRLSLEEPVTASKAAAGMGGSQVYLAAGETFPLEEMLYALMIQSANDVAMAIAEHVAGTRDGFVKLMNQKARELGMETTSFQSPHGLPPGKGQRPDVTTPRDFAKLCRALVREHPEVLEYTSARYRVFRENPLFEMRSHNRLLTEVNGCDGLKTGYFGEAGYSVAATAAKDGRRVIAVVMGSPSWKERDAKTKELLGLYLMEAKRMEAPAEAEPAAAPAENGGEEAAEEVAEPAGEEEPEVADAAPEEEETRASGGGWLKGVGLVLLGAFLATVVSLAAQRRRNMGGGAYR